MGTGLIKQHATRRLTPGASQRRQAGDRPHCVAAAGMALQPEVDPDGAGALGTVLPRESVDVGGLTPTDFARQIKADTDRWGPIVKASGAKLE